MVLAVPLMVLISRHNLRLISAIKEQLLLFPAPVLGLGLAPGHTVELLRLAPRTLSLMVPAVLTTAPTFLLLLLIFAIREPLLQSRVVVLGLGLAPVPMGGLQLPAPQEECWLTVLVVHQIILISILNLQLICVL